ncbi:MAG: hypothetical protein HYX62_07565 [Gammaproteobacteria bacterium]|nr:hypothetical protein [Gammaproteobacteria bacterium]
MMIDIPEWIARTLKCGGLAALLVVWVMPVHAAPSTAGMDAHGSEHQRRQLTLDDAAAEVRQATAGRVVSADAAEMQGRAMFRIKVLTASGQVRIFMVEPEGGKRFE